MPGDVSFEDLRTIDELYKVSNRVQNFLTENIGTIPATQFSFSLNSNIRVRRISLLNVLFSHISV
jgi:Na+/phosphate symporter